MKYKTHIRETITIIVIAILLIVILVFNAACNVGGANVRLPGMSLGAITMDGKPFEGLPSEKIDLLLEVSAREISIGYTTNSTILTLSPSGATLEITANGIIINGIKPEQIKVQWAVTKQE